MGKNPNLVKILRDCPEGTKLYSLIHGDVEFVRIDEEKSYPVIVRVANKNVFVPLTRYGKFYDSYENAECILFPSRDQRDWSKFVIQNKQKYINDLNPFDKVLTRYDDFNVWHIAFFEYIDDCGDAACFGSRCPKQCIPYNNETKDLLGTSDDCPEHYKYWED